MESAQNVDPLIDGRILITKCVGTPRHVIPIDSSVFNRYPKNAAVSEGKFDSALVEGKGNARIVEQDIEFWFFPVEMGMRMLPARSDSKLT